MIKNGYFIYCPYCGEENADSSKPSFEDLNADPNKELNALNS